VSDGPADDRATEDAARQRIAQWSGLAEQYDTYRPSPPDALLDMLAQLAGTPIPAHVVDLGAGTGLSTLVWAGYAKQITGVEPNNDMRRQAEARLAASDGRRGVRFVAGTSEATGLPDACAGIVTASQAFHWMEPVATLAEVARILRPGGVFAAYDYDWPPTITAETDALFHDLMGRAFGLAEARGRHTIPPSWEKSGHLERIRHSGHFRRAKEIALHGVESGGADRFVGLALSNAVARMLARGDLTVEEIELESFERAVRAAFSRGGASEPQWYVSYHVRVGIK
jgi:ubiquinone/menaquinone biosynthesis C-methylase UbiE